MINVIKTYLPDINKYKAYIDEIYRTGWLTNDGKFVNLLEERLRDYLNVDHILLLSNGTLALQVAYKLFDLKGKVLTTPFTFVATTSSMVWEGLEPVFVDIDDESLNMDPEQLGNSNFDDISCIVPTHVFGNGCEVDKIQAIADRYHIPVIYDAAHAFGVTYNGKSLLSKGNAAILSFHATKIFHTIEGGALILPNKDMYDKAKRMINFGIQNYKIEHVGINAKMNEFSAAMGLCMLDEIEEIMAGRKEVYDYYMSILPNNNAIQIPFQNPNSTPNYGYFPIILKDEEQVIELIRLLNSYKINPRRYFYPSLNELDYTSSSVMSNSQSIAKRILCLPLYGGLKTEDIDQIVNCVKEVIAHE